MNPASPYLLKWLKIRFTKRWNSQIAQRILHADRMGSAKSPVFCLPKCQFVSPSHDLLGLQRRRFPFSGKQHAAKE